MDEYYKCNACGAIDSIVSDMNAGICTECGSIEDYQCIEEEPTNTNTKNRGNNE